MAHPQQTDIFWDRQDLISDTEWVISTSERFFNLAADVFDDLPAAISGACYLKACIAISWIPGLELKLQSAFEAPAVTSSGSLLKPLSQAGPRRPQLRPPCGIAFAIMRTLAVGISALSGTASANSLIGSAALRISVTPPRVLPPPTAVLEYAARAVCEGASLCVEAIASPALCGVDVASRNDARICVWSSMLPQALCAAAAVAPAFPFPPAAAAATRELFALYPLDPRPWQVPRPSRGTSTALQPNALPPEARVPGVEAIIARLADAAGGARAGHDPLAWASFAPVVADAAAQARVAATLSAAGSAAPHATPAGATATPPSIIPSPSGPTAAAWLAAVADRTLDAFAAAPADARSAAAALAAAPLPIAAAAALSGPLVAPSLSRAGALRQGVDDVAVGARPTGAAAVVLAVGAAGALAPPRASVAAVVAGAIRGAAAAAEAACGPYHDDDAVCRSMAAAAAAAAVATATVAGVVGVMMEIPMRAPMSGGVSVPVAPTPTAALRTRAAATGSPTPGQSDPTAPPPVPCEAVAIVLPACVTAALGGPAATPAPAVPWLPALGADGYPTAASALRYAAVAAGWRYGGCPAAHHDATGGWAEHAEDVAPHGGEPEADATAAAAATVSPATAAVAAAAAPLVVLFSGWLGAAAARRPVAARASRRGVAACKDAAASGGPQTEGDMAMGGGTRDSHPRGAGDDGDDAGGGGVQRLGLPFSTADAHMAPADAGGSHAKRRAVSTVGRDSAPAVTAVAATATTGPSNPPGPSEVATTHAAAHATRAAACGLFAAWLTAAAAHNDVALGVCRVCRAARYVPPDRPAERTVVDMLRSRFARTASEYVSEVITDAQRELTAAHGGAQGGVSARAAPLCEAPAVRRIAPPGVGTAVGAVTVTFVVDVSAMPAAVAAEWCDLMKRDVVYVCSPAGSTAAAVSAAVHGNAALRCAPFVRAVELVEAPLVVDPPQPAQPGAQGRGQGPLGRRGGRGGLGAGAIGSDVRVKRIALRGVVDPVALREDAIAIAAAARAALATSVDGADRDKRRSRTARARRAAVQRQVAAAASAAATSRSARTSLRGAVSAALSQCDVSTDAVGGLLSEADAAAAAAMVGLATHVLRRRAAINTGLSQLHTIAALAKRCGPAVSLRRPYAATAAPVESSPFTPWAVDVLAGPTALRAAVHLAPRGAAPCITSSSPATVYVTRDDCASAKVNVDAGISAAAEARASRRRLDPFAAVAAAARAPITVAVRMPCAPSPAATATVPPDVRAEDPLVEAPTLSPAQRVAAAAVVTPRSRVAVVVGPPTAGKTYAVAAGVAVAVARERARRFLILAPSNAAVDAFGDALVAAGVPDRAIARLGHGGDGDGARAARSPLAMLASLHAAAQRALDVLRTAAAVALARDSGRTVDEVIATHSYMSAMSSAATIMTWLRQVAVTLSRRDTAPAPSEGVVDAAAAVTAAAPSWARDVVTWLAGTDDVAAAGVANAVDVVATYVPLLPARNDSEMADVALCTAARVVLATVTHMSIKRSEYLQMGFAVDTLIIDDAVEIDAGAVAVALAASATPPRLLVLMGRGPHAAPSTPAEAAAACAALASASRRTSAARRAADATDGGPHRHGTSLLAVMYARAAVAEPLVPLATGSVTPTVYHIVSPCMESVAPPQSLIDGLGVIWTAALASARGIQGTIPPAAVDASRAALATATPPRGLPRRVQFAALRPLDLLPSGALPPAGAVEQSPASGLFINESDAEAAIAVWAHLRRSGTPAADIAVVVPARAMVSLVKEVASVRCPPAARVWAADPTVWGAVTVCDMTASVPPLDIAIVAMTRTVGDALSDATCVTRVLGATRGALVVLSSLVSGVVGATKGASPPQAAVFAPAAAPPSAWFPLAALVGVGPVALAVPSSPQPGAADDQTNCAHVMFDSVESLCEYVYATPSE